MTLLQFIVFSLATWRVSSLFVNEDGPWFIFDKLRESVGIQRLTTAYQGYFVPKKFFPQLLSCVWCFSMYAGAGWVLFFFFLPTVAQWIAFPFAFSSVTIFVNLVVERLKDK